MLAHIIIFAQHVLQNHELLIKYKPFDIIYKERSTGEHSLNVYGFIQVTEFCIHLALFLY